MMRCGHCGVLSNNHRYCKGCGRAFTMPLEEVPEEKTDTQPIDFMQVVIGAIDTRYPHMELSADPCIMHPEIRVTEMVKDLKIVLIEDGKWQDVTGKESFSAFIGDIVLTFVLALLVTLGLIYSGVMPPLKAFKVYSIAYVVSALLIWGIFPYLAESTPVAFLKYNYSLIYGAVKQIRGNEFIAVFLFVLSLIYVVPPVIVLECILYAVQKERYRPLILHLLTLKYMKRLA